ncbi:hypothetical protein GF380_03285 [Candidatus Uhrbacteria bacterium]|nr:hypothetical protein [Candidatus Uhrbacteria bacterium]MBD3284159.1 hypothetical protein [Candidatus Uhrbacteria bacterium]
MSAIRGAFMGIGAIVEYLERTTRPPREMLMLVGLTHDQKRLLKTVWMCVRCNQNSQAAQIACEDANISWWRVLTAMNIKHFPDPD